MMELVCAAIVAVWIIAKLREERSSRVLVRYALLAVAGCLAEDTVIRAYGFYGYSDAWTLYVDRVPLLVALIWPVVILSAWDLARYLGGGPLLAAALVLADASLIEPVAVRAGLWSWTEPGLFTVPPIGIVGWAFFAGLAVWALERPWRLLVIVPVVHGMLIVSWWGAFKWVNGDVPVWAAVGVAWTASIVLTVLARRARVPLTPLLLRIPGALFFFVLLVRHGGPTALWAWAFAFVPPYLALCNFRGTAAENVRRYVRGAR